MARTNYGVKPPPQHQANTPKAYPHSERTFLQVNASIDGDNVQIAEMANADSELLMMPKTYEDRNDVGEDAEWRTDDDGDAGRCWKTTLIYQHIGRHPNVVRFLRPDEWTWLPVLANPGGPNLQKFLDSNRSEMYDQRESGKVDKSTACARVKRSRLKLVYQWALQLASALKFIHNYSFEEPAPKISIAFGDLGVDDCWLDASGTSLSLLGFLRSSFRTRSSPQHIGNIGLSGRDFQPLGRRGVPSLQTDVFYWGCVVYELMTGYWPGEGQGLAQEEMESLVSRREWPRLETEYLGDVVRKSWTGEVTSAAELWRAVRGAITESGVVVGDNDEIIDIALDGMTI